MVVETSSPEQTGVTTRSVGAASELMAVNLLAMVDVVRSILKDCCLPDGFFAEFLSSRRSPFVLAMLMQLL